MCSICLFFFMRSQFTVTAEKTSERHQLLNWNRITNGQSKRATHTHTHKLGKNDRFSVGKLSFFQIKCLPTSLFVVRLCEYGRLHVWWYILCKIPEATWKGNTEFFFLIDIEAKVIPHHRSLLGYRGGAVVEWIFTQWFSATLHTTTM